MIPELENYRQVIDAAKPVATSVLEKMLLCYVVTPPADKGRVQMAALPADVVVSIIAELLRYREHHELMTEGL